MRPPFLLITMFFVLITVAFIGADVYIGIQANIFTANLRLADDASTPEMKSACIKKFIAVAEQSDLPTHAAWIWKSEQNSVQNQLDVLRSLAKRCDDTAELDKSSFGYAQGMTQITGQEFDHAIGSVMGVFETAYKISYGVFVNFGGFVFVFLSIVFGFITMATWDE